MTKKYVYPEKSGKIDIFPEISEGNSLSVTIIGDPNGLRYLAELLRNMSDLDLSGAKYPAGTREHIHLHANAQLGARSCEVEICRADARGTGELPDFMIFQ